MTGRGTSTITRSAIPKTLITTVVSDDLKNKVIDILISGAKSGEGSIGDGKIFISKVDDAIRICDEMKFPVMLKASSGGGGKGLRVVENKGDIKDAYLAAQAESLASFNDDSIYVEKYIQNPRHNEIQIIADK